MEQVGAADERGVILFETLFSRLNDLGFVAWAASRLFLSTPSRRCCPLILRPQSSFKRRFPLQRRKLGNQEQVWLLDRHDRADRARHRRRDRLAAHVDGRVHGPSVAVFILTAQSLFFFSFNQLLSGTKDTLIKSDGRRKGCGSRCNLASSLPCRTPKSEQPFVPFQAQSPLRRSVQLQPGSSTAARPLQAPLSG